MKNSLEFDQKTYRERTGMPISNDAVIVVSRSFDALVEINRIMSNRMSARGAIYAKKIEIGAENLWVGLSQDAVTGRYLEELGVDTVGVTNAILDYKAPIGRDGRSILYMSDSVKDDSFSRINGSADNALVRAC